MISSIVFINSKGEILIYRIYKDDISRAETMQFCTNVVARKESKESPIVNIDGTSFIHVSYKDIILLATTKCNINAAMTIQFLYQLINVCKSYFGDFDENNIRKQFVLIYELLDEIMDYGLPQILDPDLLKQSIQEGGKQDGMTDIEKLKQFTQQATNAQSWRAPNIFYKKNEVYIDIIESVNVSMSVKGSILKADVSGKVMVKALLSGVPDCKFGMNDKVLMEKEPPKPGSNPQQGGQNNKGITIDDLKFHPCVVLPKFDKERAITFTPPDGEFQLMSYRITENVNLPFKIMPVINEDGNNIEVRVKLKSIFDKTQYATNVALKVPCPKNTANTSNTASIGRAKYEPEQGGIVWRIKKFQGETEALLRCEIVLSNTALDKNWVKPPISLEFQVPSFTASGLRVRFLRIHEKSGYHPTKWIRYITKGGEYLHRI
ncbi:clathrin adapter protein AP-1, mu subunit (macronuclear) [Tetrahymena thermophila SB210]|uniref:Clathrin adapter protein AP-1, mu subunit n=2 Tax=Tetrahymena thermophila TaxID=5911 RepID=Q22V00_TETTS|nr:clathrin adapter protein AP-1, mu subunit [Tetrahymena thermophila SB210]ABB13590.1 Apm2p [Tetrahymena thermophila]EAR89148.1 clathrin adapter protein AP-1, mu subunit [Tetrahymena thermophila SB210]|eukprot:XP_001009393.1 clathrin adapter protein AP-1, mu subunit [Tetrahymena thermophila SB210]